MALITLKNGSKVSMGKQMFCGTFSKPSNPKYYPYSIPSITLFSDNVIG